MKIKYLLITCSLSSMMLLSGCGYAVMHTAEYVIDQQEKNPETQYYKKHELSLKHAKDHNSEADKMFDYLHSYAKGEEVYTQKQKYGEKFFLTFVQEDCAACIERCEAFEYLEEHWNKDSFQDLDGSFKLHTIFVDSKDEEGNDLFNYLYNRSSVAVMLEETVSYMSGEYADHPYKNNSDSSYIYNLDSLLDYDGLSTPTTFLIDLTDCAPDWTSSHGVREVLFAFGGANGTDKIAMAKTLSNAWTNTPSTNNKFSPSYIK